MKILALLLGLCFFYPSTGYADDSILGAWRKIQTVSNGKRNGDPRWELHFTFMEDKTFRCSSKTTREEWVQEIQTGRLSVNPIVSSHELNGSYSTEKNILILNFDGQERFEPRSCGLWAFGLSVDPIVRVFFSKGKSELFLSSMDKNHKIFFERQKN